MIWLATGLAENDWRLTDRANTQQFYHFSMLVSELDDCQWGAIGKDHRSRTACYESWGCDDLHSAHLKLPVATRQYIQRKLSGSLAYLAVCEHDNYSQLSSSTLFMNDITAI